MTQIDTEQMRRDVRADVLGRRAVDARERTSLAAFVEAFDQLPRPFDEHADRVHVTASAIVVGARGVVLHRHKRMGIWLQPGGHIEPGEPPPDAALREAQEETGLPVGWPDGGPRLVHVDVHPGPRGHRHLDLRYLVESPPEAPRPPQGESQDVQWFTWHRAVAAAEPGLEGVLRALQPGQPVVRQVRANDARECAHVLRRSRAFALVGVPEVHEASEVRRWMADEVIGHHEMWVADLDGTIVGLLVLSPGWIEQLYLDPAWIGRGLGDRFMEIVGRRQPEGTQLWTFQANEPAQRFYTRHGFVEVERTDGSGNEERSPDIRYRRPV